MSEIINKKQWWLVELDMHGNPSLIDGSHSSKKGVEQALYLRNRLGFSGVRKFAAACITLSEVEAISHNSNEDALNTLNSIGLKP